MEIKFYSYGNIVRILSLDSEFTKSIMIDVDLDDKKILSLFDAQSKFDADFIQSYLNILRESTVGFRLLTDESTDTTLKAKAINILGLNQSWNPKITDILSVLRFSIPSAPCKNS